MKLSTTIPIAFLLTLTAAMPATDVYTSTEMHHKHHNTTITRRGVPKYQAPRSWTGKCHKGTCKLDTFNGAPCLNSHCDKDGSSCIVAWGTNGQQAKCPVNDLDHDWDWPWIDQAWKDASDKYQECKKEQTDDSKCNYITGGPAKGSQTSDMPF